MMKQILPYLPEQAINIKLPIRYWVGDESLFGLKTITRRLITIKGVKPVGQVQWSREYYYLYGLAEPKTGESFFWEFSHLDSYCFGQCLNLFSQAYSDSLNVIQVDQATAHTAFGLKIPNNIILLFQPAHSPELNPIERVWQHIKEFLSWQVFESLEDLRLRVREILSRELTAEVVYSLTGWQSHLSFLSDAGI